MDINYYINLIKNAVNNVEQGYYKIKTTYNNEGIVRERVFCYELYYQIRIIDNDGDLTLHGEIDKRGHKEIKKNDQKNPDFIFHHPGGFERNSIVMEVKGKLEGSIGNYKEEKDKWIYKGIYKDLITLDRFINNCQYKAGILLIYNHSLEELKKFLNGKYNRFLMTKSWGNIKIIIKKDAYTKCIERQLVDILNENIEL
ncbi:MAG: hypothetical protein WC983_05930 [Tissierellaceae bacterium]